MLAPKHIIVLNCSFTVTVCHGRGLERALCVHFLSEISDSDCRPKQFAILTHLVSPASALSIYTKGVI